MSIAIAPISSIVCILGHFFHFSGQPGVIFHILQNVVKMMILMSINHKPFHLRLWASQFAPKICSLQVLMCNYLFSANQDVQLFLSSSWPLAQPSWKMMSGWISTMELDHIQWISLGYPMVMPHGTGWKPFPPFRCNWQHSPDIWSWNVGMRKIMEGRKL